MRLETLIELKFFSSSFVQLIFLNSKLSSLSSY